jgi:hypothetical protein
MDPIPEGFGEFENISSSAIFTGKTFQSKTY